MDEQIEQYLAGELNTSERIALLQRIASDEAYKKQYIRYKNISGMLSLVATSGDEAESLRSYRRLLTRIQKRFARRQVRQCLRYAAACTLIAGLTYWLTLLSERSALASDACVSLYVPAGQRLKVSLPDGTDVWLNAKTTLTYPTVFGTEERHVQIDGEGFFCVAKDTGRPFVVTAHGVDVQALGTRFNLLAYAGQPSVRASLVEGKLKVSRPQTQSQAVILNPNEEATVCADRITTGVIPHADYFLWKEGIYSFHNELLSDVLSKLEMYYDVTINVQDPTISNWAYTGKFRQRDGIDEIIRMIRKIHRFEIEKDEENNLFTLK